MGTSNIKKLILFFSLFFLAEIYLSADSLSEGEKFFRVNQYQDAIFFLEQAKIDSPDNPSVYNMLGLSYYQAGRNAEALETLLAGANLPGNKKFQLYYNAGNVAFAMGDFYKAEECFTQAFKLNANFPDSLLNRANTRLKMDNLPKALLDYELYLNLEPETPQKAKIEKIILLLKNECPQNCNGACNYCGGAPGYVNQNPSAYNESVETRSRPDYSNLLNDDNRRNEASDKAQRDAERRKRLLEEISASLEEADSTNFSAGNEGVEDYEQQSELD